MTEAPAKSPAALRTISEVSDQLGVPQHILRFWETRFPELKPLKRGGNRRYYRPEDIALCRTLKRLLHEEGYTVKGVRKLLADRGLKAVVAEAATPASPPASPALATRPVAPAAPALPALAPLLAVRARLQAALAAA